MRHCGDNTEPLPLIPGSAIRIINWLHSKSWLLIQMSSLRKYKTIKHEIAFYIYKQYYVLLLLFPWSLVHDYSSIHTDYEVTRECLKKCIRKGTAGTSLS